MPITANNPQIYNLLASQTNLIYFNSSIFFGQLLLKFSLVKFVTYDLFEFFDLHSLNYKRNFFDRIIENWKKNVTLLKYQSYKLTNID